ncbi:FAS1-like dehydratase domain-containing protein [Terrarubrum flagellatum]|uniref:FAS1-like dehydratase domain-containing protein n=1 Tax=Terrirubrum flagellatum TaxID=2895980 RepID=UPI0031452EC3
MSLDIDHLRSWIGRTEEAEDVITPRLVAEYEATFAPHLAEVGDGEAPLGLHWCLAPPIRPMSELGPDGHPAKGGFLPPVPLPRRMWAGGTIEYRAPLKAGDRVVRHSTIEDVSAKIGRTGSLCFVAVRHEIATARGLALSERHDIVYREANAPGAASVKPEAPPAAAERADITWTVEASPVLLFRYSAMTFNGHRIHYDHPYVTGVEGYAGLVVHGPIQSTLLFNLAATLGEKPPALFSYRGLSPLTDGPAFRVAARRETDGRVTAWTESADGRICMRAEASF